ncbi:MAG: hypothetical protein QM789_00010 [Paenirhodobacter sp.]
MSTTQDTARIASRCFCAARPVRCGSGTTSCRSQACTCAAFIDGSKWPRPVSRAGSTAPFTTAKTGAAVSAAISCRTASCASGRSIHQDQICQRHLPPGLLMLAQAGQSGRRIDRDHHAIHRETLGQVDAGQQRVQDRRRIGEARRLDHHPPEPQFIAARVQVYPACPAGHPAARSRRSPIAAAPWFP